MCFEFWKTTAAKPDPSDVIKEKKETVFMIKGGKWKKIESISKKNEKVLHLKRQIEFMLNPVC